MILTLCAFAARYGSSDSFHRQYLLYQHAYAIVETLVPKLRHGNIRTSSSPSQKAYQTDVLEPLFRAARSCISICLSKWTLYHALPYMPRHTLVQISYVALLALQLAHVSLCVLTTLFLTRLISWVSSVLGKSQISARSRQSTRRQSSNCRSRRTSTSRCTLCKYDTKSRRTVSASTASRQSKIGYRYASSRVCQFR